MVSQVEGIVLKKINPEFFGKSFVLKPTEKYYDYVVSEKSKLITNSDVVYEDLESFKASVDKHNKLFGQD